MRESNFAFPAQNRACVCISSQLYDRRALDTNAALPLFNSLTHLTYLTSTSPRIREIMTMDGGLERLVRILHEFCISPPPPENPSIFYGLTPPASHSPPSVPTLLPKTYDKQAAYRFSLAFQCVVNIGVRGSEPIRSRVVQAGTLEVVGCILEAWLASKGFAVGPSAGAGAIPRETREQRLARRQAQNELRQREQEREQALELARALARQVAVNRNMRREQSATPFAQELNRDATQDDPMDTEQAGTGASQDPDTSAETSSNATPFGGNTPTGVVVVPGRDRSGTIIARPVWDGPSTATIRGTHHHHRSRLAVPDESAGPSADNSADNSRPETETEDDGDVDMDRESGREVSGSPSPERSDSTSGMATVRRAQRGSIRRAVGIVTDGPAPDTTVPSIDMNTDAHIIINDQAVAVEGGVGGVEDGIVSLEPNNDFAMGAPPGAPGAIAIDGPPMRDHAPTGERTPRAGTANLPMVSPIAVPPVPTNTALRMTMTTGGAEAGVGAARAGGVAGRTRTPGNQNAAGLNNTTGTGIGASPHGGLGGHHHHAREETGPYRDEDVLLSLQLLAYLSKYPHVRQAFYKPRVSFHPAAAQQPAGEGRFAQPVAGPSTKPAPAVAPLAKEPSSLMKVLNSATGRGKEKEKAFVASAPPANSPRMTNVFSLVERFTFRHSSSDMESSNPPPSLPPEIQYWAGVIMRNACRKDESRGGIRQCANMLCGRWESFPREFAKCRRCRKAKYCGKECQSTAWSEGHRFWCSAKDPEEDAEHHHTDATTRNATVTPGANTGAGAGAAGTGTTAAGGATTTIRGERRTDRDRERERLARAAETRLALEALRPPAAMALNTPGPGRDQAVAAAEAAAEATAAAVAETHQATWGTMTFRRLGRRENDTAPPPPIRPPGESLSPRALAEFRAAWAGRHQRLMGGALPDEQLPPEVRRQIIQARQDPTDRGEGPSVGPSRDATMLGDGSGDDMIIG